MDGEVASVPARERVSQYNTPTGTRRMVDHFNSVSAFFRSSANLITVASAQMAKDDVLETRGGDNADNVLASSPTKVIEEPEWHAKDLQPFNALVM